MKKKWKLVVSSFATLIFMLSLSASSSVFAAGTTTADSAVGEAANLTVDTKMAQNYSTKSLPAKQVNAKLQSSQNSGSCGQRVTWSISSDETLIISGSGAMNDYVYNLSGSSGNSTSERPAPWYSSRTQIKKILIKEGVTEIGQMAFCKLTSVSSVTLPKSLTTIGEGAFYGCMSLKNVSIPSSVKTLPAGLFAKCTTLKSVTLPEGITNVQDQAFQETALKEIKIPASVQYFSPLACVNCTNFQQYTVAPANAVYSTSNQVLFNKNRSVLVAMPKHKTGAYAIPSGVTAIGDAAFISSNLTSITIPSSVKQIGSMAFGATTQLKEIVIPKSVVKLEYAAFDGSSALNKVTINASIKTIPINAFNDCPRLRRVVLPRGLKQIGSGAFGRCSALTDINFPDSLIYIAGDAFENSRDFTSEYPSELNQMSDGSYMRMLYKSTPKVQYYQNKARNMLGYVNQFRTNGKAWYWNEGDRTKTTQVKKASLAYDYGLEEIAKQRAAEIAFKFSHTRPNGLDCFSAKASDGSTSYGENIAVGSQGAPIYGDSERAVFNMFKEENNKYAGQGHRRNMLGNYNAIGIACVKVNGTYYWVQEFGDRTSVKNPGVDNNTKYVSFNISPDNVASAKLNNTHQDYNLSVGDEIQVTSPKQNIYLTQEGWGEYNPLIATTISGWEMKDNSVAAIDNLSAIGDNVTLAGLKKGTTKMESTVLYGRYQSKDNSSKVTVKNVSRIYGSTRYETAQQTAGALKAKMNVDKFDAVVIAYGENYPDALSGTYLANVKQAPLLLANAKDANTEANTVDYVEDNVSSGGKVYILGGPGLVSSTLENTLRSQGYSVARLYGSDRYITNIKILNAAGIKQGQDLLVCTGENYPDALSTSALGKPILLIGGQSQPTSAQRTIIQGKNVYIIGGTAAISDRTKNSISRNAKRINGIDRYDTSAKLAKQFCKNPTTAVLAYGQNFPDGLAGGTLAYKVNAPLLLATSSSVGNKSIANYVDSTQINSMYVLGGPGLISNNAAESVLRFDK